jgi:hypothetical protein
MLSDSDVEDSVHDTYPRSSIERTGPLTPAETRRALRTSMIAQLFRLGPSLVTGALRHLAREKLHVHLHVRLLPPYLGVSPSFSPYWWSEPPPAPFMMR